jgi:hypothetical protein
MLRETSARTGWRNRQFGFLAVRPEPGRRADGDVFSWPQSSQSSEYRTLTLRPPRLGGEISELLTRGVSQYSITPALQYSSDFLSHLTFEDFQAVITVHQVEQPIIAAKNVIAFDCLLAFPGLGDVVSNFFGTVWVGNIQGAETAAEPGDIERVVVNLFRRLMATDFKFRVRARARRKNVSRDRHRMGLIDNINDPKKGWRQGSALLRISVSHREVLD